MAIMFWYVSLALLASLLQCLLGAASTSQNANPLGRLNGTNKQQPNIIFLLTDDQDLEMGSLDYMPNLHKYMIQQGTTYNKHFCTISLCCPSRVSLLTGRLAHNTNVTDVLGPYGGYEVFISQGLNDKYLPVWLQDAGYNTYYSGKLFNSHSFENYDKPFAAGWNGSEFLLDPYQYDYYEPGFARNHDAPIAYPGNYSTDMVKDFAMGFLDEAVEAGSPFFLGIAPIASHAEVLATDNGTNAVSSPPQPHTQYANLFPNASVPRTPNFNPDVPSGAGWIYSLPQINSSNVESFDEWYRDRLRSLQSVEEIIEELMVKLEAYDILDNTYIFYTTDNGYHIGQHRLPPGKTCPWETDVHIPLIIRGPGIAANVSTEVPTSHTDLTPTFFEMFGIPLRPEFDGAPIPYTQADFANETKTAREHIGIEFWNNRDPNENGPGLLFGLYNTTYKAIRIVGDTYEIYYSVWCENYHEMYDMIADPYQMHNLFAFGSNTTSTELVPTNATLLGASLDDVATRLDGMMMVLKTCTAESCRQPWKSLITDGSVTDLQQALDPKYDSLFEQLPRVSWTWCDPGYIISAEGPQFDNITIIKNKSRNFIVIYI